MKLISIIIPMRNAESWIAATLGSLLSQREVTTEIIVIDDGSTDRSADIVRRVGAPTIRLLPGPQRGISAAFNAGLSAARGEFLCRCDADDLYPPDRLARQLRFLAEHSEFGAVCGAYSTIDSRGRHIAEHFTETTAADMTDELLRGIGRSHVCAYLFRTELVRRLGGCREWFVTSEDADLQYRLAETTRIWFDPAVAYLYRLHESSITHAQKSAERKFFEQQARRFLQQRRETGDDDLQRGTPPAVPDLFEEAAAQSAREQIQQLMLGEAWRHHARGRRLRAVATGLRAALRRPNSATAWRSLLALSLKPCTMRSSP